MIASLEWAERLLRRMADDWGLSRGRSKKAPDPREWEISCRRELAEPRYAQAVSRYLAVRDSIADSADVSVETRVQLLRRIDTLADVEGYLAAAYRRSVDTGWGRLAVTQVDPRPPAGARTLIALRFGSHGAAAPGSLPTGGGGTVSVPGPNLFNADQDQFFGEALSGAGGSRPGRGPLDHALAVRRDPTRALWLGARLAGGGPTEKLVVSLGRTADRTNEAARLRSPPGGRTDLRWQRIDGRLLVPGCHLFVSHSAITVKVMAAGITLEHLELAESGLAPGQGPAR
jgi:hypothetical protein